MKMKQLAPMSKSEEGVFSDGFIVLDSNEMSHARGGGNRNNGVCTNNARCRNNSSCSGNGGKCRGNGSCHVTVKLEPITAVSELLSPVEERPLIAQEVE